MFKKRNGVCLFLAIILLFCGIYVNMEKNTVSAATVTIYSVAGTGVAIRSEPSTRGGNNTVLTRVSNVEVNYIGQTEKQADGYVWYNVSYNIYTGYVRGDYIRVQTIEIDNSIDAALAQFPQSYHEGLKKLHAQYPNWVFKADYVPLTFKEAVQLEAYPQRKQADGSYLSRLSMEQGCYDWSTGRYVTNNGTWYSASYETIAYYMDPRNFLDSTSVIMFMQQGYDSSTQTLEGLRTVVAGTFLQNGYNGNYDAYITDIMLAAQATGVSPYVIASIIIQEQGTGGTSSIISGTHGDYPGYYNFFNVKASGVTTADVIANGLKYAYQQGWDTRQEAIIGGARFYAEGYIARGQDTYFYKNYNVMNPSSINHQYAQAVHDSYSLASRSASSFNSNKNGSLTFKIPVYSDMPATPCAIPAKSQCENNYYITSIDAGGYLSPSFHRFTYSYNMAIEGNTTIGITLPEGALYVSQESFPLYAGNNVVTLTVMSETGYTRDYVINVYTSAEAWLNIAVGGNFSQQQKKGDINGDGKISLTDFSMVKKHILGSRKLSDNEKKYADINEDGKISLADFASIKKHLLGIIIIE